MRNPGESAGMMMLVSIEETACTKDLLCYLKEYHIGGVVLFSPNIENPEQIGSFLEELRGELPDLLVAIDEEGGTVSRLKGLVDELPGNAAIGRYYAETGDRETIVSLASLLASQVGQFGFNWDLAPVLDICRNETDDFIGKRSFGTRPDLVGDLGRIFIEVLQKKGIMACAKHFPGHGHTSVDSHSDLPELPHTIDRLVEFEFVPFSASIEAGVDSIMSAHINLPNIDRHYISTMSATIMTQLLRIRLGFDGLIVSDDLTMGAIAKLFVLEDAALQTLKAGCDMVTMRTSRANQLKVWENITTAIETGDLPPNQISATIQRIRQRKDRYCARFRYDSHASQVLQNQWKTRELLAKFQAYS